MAEFYRNELEKNYNEKCKEILNFCFIEDENKKQTQYYEPPFGACNFTVPPPQYPPITMQQPVYVPNYQSQPMVQPQIQPYNITPYGYSMPTYDHHDANPADFDRKFYNNQQHFLGYPNTTVSSPYVPPNIPNNNPVNYGNGTQNFPGTFGQFEKKIKESHNYDNASGGFDHSLDRNEVRRPFSASSSNYNARSYSSDSYGGKTYKKFRKYPKYVPPKKEENNDADIDIDVDAVIASLKKRSETKSNFIEIIQKFSRLSVYAMEMCRERMSLENLITGYTNSVNSYYLPTVISNISGHIKIIRQSLGYEFYEIWKLIDSIDINFQKEHESNVREFFRQNLSELEYFENVKVKQKNGEILLSNDKITLLQTLATDITDAIRYYSIYMTGLQFVYKKNQNEYKNKMETKNLALALEDNSEYKNQTIDDTVDQELQISKLNLTDLTDDEVETDENQENRETQSPIQFVRPARGPGF